MPYTFTCPCGHVSPCPRWIPAYWYDRLTLTCWECGTVLTAFGGELFDIDLTVPVGTITHTPKDKKR